MVSALLLACAFPLPPVLKGLESSSGIWLALIPLIIVVRLSRPRAAFWWSWLCGFMFWLVSLSWVLQLRNSWGMLPLVIVSWVGLAAYCALYIGLFGFLLAKIFPETDARQESEPSSVGIVLSRIMTVLSAPVIWVGCEYLRGLLGTGFPWNTLGASQYTNVASIQIAALGGVYAVSATIVLLNASLALTALRTVREIRYRLPRGRVHYELMVGLLVVALSWSAGVRRIQHGDKSFADLDTLRVAVVQPNIKQPKKWSEGFAQECYLSLMGESEFALTSSPQLMIWPETAIPDVLPVEPVAQAAVSRFVSTNTSLLLGSMNYLQHGYQTDYFNSSFLVGDAGRIVGEYRKRHLVPFGEYLPLANRIPLIKRFAPLGFSCTPGGEQALLKLAVGEDVWPFGILICFEDIFGYLSRQDVRKGALFLVNQTNDAWFDGSAAAHQHMANAVFRAVENRVPLVRCANTGVSCFVDRFGRVYKVLGGQHGGTGMNGFSVSELRFEPAGRRLTPYTKFGDWLLAIPAMLVVLGLLFWSILSVVVRRRQAA